MKGFIFACILVGCVTSVSSQTGLTPATPDAVLKSFIKMYGDEKVTWTETDGNYEANFKLIGMPATAWFDSTGHRKKVVVEIKEEQLPSIARSYIDRNYAKAKVVKARKWTDDNKVNTFEADIKVGTETKKLMFTSKGELIE